jgi:hypothetical protein
VVTWNLKIGLAFVVALAAIFASVMALKMAWAFFLGVGCGVALCAFFPQVEDGARAVLGACKTFLLGIKPNIPDRNGARADTLQPPQFPKAVNFDGQAVARAASNLFTGAGRILSFLWEHKRALLVISLFFFGMGLLRGCVHLPTWESREHAIVRADTAERIAEHNKEIGRASVEIMDAFHAREASITHDLESAREAVESVPDDAAQIDVLRAWARADRSLLDNGNAPG